MLLYPFFFLSLWIRSPRTLSVCILYLLLSSYEMDTACTRSRRCPLGIRQSALFGLSRGKECHLIKKKNVKAHFLSQIPSCSPLIQLPSPAIVLPPSLVFGVAQRRTEFRKQEVRDEFCRGHSLFERRCRPLFVILIVIRRGGGRDKFQGLCQRHTGLSEPRSVTDMPVV